MINIKSLDVPNFSLLLDKKLVLDITKTITKDVLKRKRSHKIEHNPLKIVQVTKHYKTYSMIKSILLNNSDINYKLDNNDLILYNTNKEFILRGVIV